jgi:hypothetical protein
MAQKKKCDKMYYWKRWIGCSLMRAVGVSCFPSSRPRNKNIASFDNKKKKFISTVNFTNFGHKISGSVSALT